MRIAVLSGKGGTGKTFCAVNLASVRSGSIYADCDIEEPDGHLFFKPKENHTEEIKVFLPKIHDDLCNGCRACVEFCRFGALGYVNRKIIVFEDVCHSCGGCELVCPRHAISETSRKIGVVEDGVSAGVRVISGILEPGMESGVPIIKKINEITSKSDGLVIIDCPPGSSCSAIESIKSADYCLLIAEPTIFGAHDLAMVHDMIRISGKPCGVVLNKITAGPDPSADYCLTHKIPIMGRVPYDPKLGRIISEARIAVREDRVYHVLFDEILERILKEASHETAANPKR
jgi:MinD superfamily P-loop ATPase